MKVERGLAILVEAFGTLGIELKFRYRPDKRSIIEANTGVVDGEFVRVASIVSKYPNLVVVPEPLSKMNLVAFSVQPKVDLSAYKLSEHQYRVGYLSGWANAEDLLKDYPNRMAIGEYDTLFKLLVHNRIDVVVFNRVAGEKILRSHRVNDYQISPSLLSYSTFLVMHKEHAALVPGLVSAIRKAKLNDAKKYSEKTGDEE